jgi:hypothetical protein
MSIRSILLKTGRVLLTDGFYAEVTLTYDAVIAQQNAGRPFGIEGLRPIQLSKSDALDVLARGRKAFATSEWIDFLMRSIGLEPSGFSQRAKWVTLLRMVAFVERNYTEIFGGRTSQALVASVRIFSTYSKSGFSLSNSCVILSARALNFFSEILPLIFFRACFTNFPKAVFPTSLANHSKKKYSMSLVLH